MVGPVAPPRRPVGRLGTLNKPAPGRPKPKAKAVVQAKCCDEPSITDEDGSKVCINCGTQISESNIVADVTFEEDSRGAATVQGGFISERSRFANTLGTAGRRIGAGERNGLQEIENNGRRALAALCPRLGIPQNVADQAQALIAASARLNFSAGRRTDEVVAACLFTACKRQAGNSILLMDIAELVKINVFRLGEVYKALCDKLHYHQEHVGVQHQVDIEPLIWKYCRKLEFGPETRDVATDAVRILKRMNRDWITTGRHPAGLCGACIILAARMNNFKRSVREVVFVAKVCDVTIAKRVEEFRRTRASALTVDQFREYGTRLKHAEDPPILHYTELRKDKLEAQKRKRDEDRAIREADGMSVAEGQTPERETIVIPDDEDSEAGTPVPESTTETSEAEPSRKKQRTTEPGANDQVPRYDADGFAIPALPLRTPTPAAEEEEAATAPPPKRRGRPRKKKPEPVEITPDELSIEEELSHEIDVSLHDEYVRKMYDEAEKAKIEDKAEAEAARVLPQAGETADLQLDVEESSENDRRASEGVSWVPREDPVADYMRPLTAEEFADDPEVENCLLTPAESKIKEQIWVANNEDWLRAQHEKDLIKKLAEASNADKAKNGTKRGGKKTGPKKKRGRVGDGSVLEEADTPIETPADATSAMLKKRAGPGFSKYIDYESLARVYKKSDGSESVASQSQSRESSVAAPGRESSATPSVLEGAERDSATPAPPARSVHFGLQSPQTTQAVSAIALPATTAARTAGRRKTDPISPPPTQAPDHEQEQTEPGAPEEEEYQGELGDEFDGEGYQSDGDGDGDAAPGGWTGDADDGEEFAGEEDYGDFDRAIDPENFYDDGEEGGGIF
ncbi:transcription factor TFIIIB subunit brf1 [Recurvomyces mirabilis]|nr:transcription factor TFIIIB subunit brf1 [Recurvomyces mirabilis]